MWQDGQHTSAACPVEGWSRAGPAHSAHLWASSGRASTAARLTVAPGKYRYRYITFVDCFLDVVHSGSVTGAESFLCGSGINNLSSSGSCSNQNHTQILSPLKPFVQLRTWVFFTDVLSLTGTGKAFG
jgi:hypothetical protein